MREKTNPRWHRDRTPTIAVDERADELEARIDGRTNDVLVWLAGIGQGRGEVDALIRPLLEMNRKLVARIEQLEAGQAELRTELSKLVSKPQKEIDLAPIQRAIAKLQKQVEAKRTFTHKFKYNLNGDPVEGV